MLVWLTKTASEYHKIKTAGKIRLLFRLTQPNAQQRYLGTITGEGGEVPGKLGEDDEIFFGWVGHIVLVWCLFGLMVFCWVWFFSNNHMCIH